MLHRFRTLIVMVSFIALNAPAAAQDADNCRDVPSVGVATMKPDGEIVLRIRSLPPGPIAEGELHYRPDDPKYAEIKRHLRGIAPGETKPVRPWCDDSGKP